METVRTDVLSVTIAPLYILALYSVKVPAEIDPL